MSAAKSHQHEQTQLFAGEARTREGCNSGHPGLLFTPT